MCLIFVAISLVGCDGGGGSGDTIQQQAAIDLGSAPFRQTGWCWQQPQPHGLETHDIFFIDDLNGWLVGDLGLIMRTVDGGTTWTEQSIPADMSPNDLKLVKFIDTQRGWIAGATDWGLWHTEDGGLNWIATTPTPVRYVTAIWLVGENIVVLTGHSGAEPTPDVSAVSEDGGQTWREAALVVNQVEEDGTLWGWNGSSRSNDLGVTVETAFEPDWPQGSFVSELGFGTGGFAWAILNQWQSESASWKDFIAQRAGTGMPWVTQPLLAPASATAYQVVSVTLDANGSGLALVWPDPLPDGPINALQQYARTSDGGSHWEWISLPPDKEGMADWSHQFIDTKTISVSYGTDSGSYYLTTDAGLTWKNTFQQPLDTNIDMLRFRRDLSGQLIAVANNSGSSRWLRSSDQGVTWLELPSPKVIDEDIIGVWLAGDGQGFAITSAGTVFDTNDHGQHWSVRSVPKYGYVRDLRMNSNGSGWMVADGRLLHTVDGGGSWTETQVSSLGQSSLVHLLYADGSHLRVEALEDCPVSSGMNFCDTVLHSSNDGGLTWQQGNGTLCFVDGLQIRAVGFATADIAVRADGDTVDRSTDGGQTWTPITTLTARGSVNRIRFQDAQHGWMIGYDGGSWRTSDGGLTWTAGNLPLPNGRYNPSVRPWLRDVAFADHDHGWIVGDDGVVLATTDGGENWTLQPSATPYPLYAIAALDSRTAWIAGAKSTILATDTGGNKIK